MAWQIDNAHSQIEFSVRHMMISNVRGRFDRFSGTVDFDPENPVQSSAEIQIDAGSINTREEQRDGHLKSADFLHVEDYPQITFKSNRIEVVDDSHGRVIGELTIRDVTNEVALDVTYNGQAKSPWGTVSAGFSAEAKINRKDWNLTWNQVLETGGVLVGDQITMNIEVELVKQPEEAAA